MINKKEAKLKALEQSVTLDPIQKQLIIIQKDSINASLETLKTHKINYYGMVNDELLRRCCGARSVNCSYFNLFFSNVIYRYNVKGQGLTLRSQKIKS